MIDYPILTQIATIFHNAVASGHGRPGKLIVPYELYEPLRLEVCRILDEAQAKDDIEMAENFAPVVDNGQMVAAFMGVPIYSMPPPPGAVARPDMTIDQPSMN